MSHHVASDLTVVASAAFVGAIGTLAIIVGTTGFRRARACARRLRNEHLTTVDVRRVQELRRTSNALIGCSLILAALAASIGASVAISTVSIDWTIAGWAAFAGAVLVVGGGIFAAGAVANEPSEQPAPSAAAF